MKASPDQSVDRESWLVVVVVVVTMVIMMMMMMMTTYADRQARQVGLYIVLLQCVHE